MHTASTTIIKPKLPVSAHTQALEYMCGRFAKIKTKKFHAYLSPSVTSSPSSVVNEILREDRWAFHVSDMVDRELTFRKIVQFSCNTEERKSVYKAYQQPPGYSAYSMNIQLVVYKRSNKFLLSIWYARCRWKLMPQGYSCLLSHLLDYLAPLIYHQTTLNLPECNSV